MVKVQESSDKRELVVDFVKGFEVLIVNYLSLISTENLNDYNVSRDEIKLIILENRFLQADVESIVEELELDLNFFEKIDEYKTISDKVISIQEDVLIAENEFVEKAKYEKKLRHVFRDLTPELSSLEFTAVVSRMMYLSKEALYQYGDDAHLQKWLIKIDEMADYINSSNLSNKDSLRDDLDAYKIVANEMVAIAINRKIVREEKKNLVDDLSKISIELENSGTTVKEKIEKENQIVARNIFILIISITFVAIVSLLVFKRKLYSS